MPLDKTVNGFCTGELYYVEDNLFSYEATETFLLNWVLMEMLPFFLCILWFLCCFSIISLSLCECSVSLTTSFSTRTIKHHHHHQRGCVNVLFAVRPIQLWWVSTISRSRCRNVSLYMSVCTSICGGACSVRGHLLLNMHHRLKKKSGAHYSWCCEQRASKFARIAYVQ